ncbi:MAG: TIR domain-containing protein [Acidobacteriota bacterium]|nr:TIR domain-containing protein [Acidobacteriota bacterium]
MADIFLSYANRDVDRIRLIVEVLEQQGWSVWWDYKIRIGRAFDQVIEEEITKAKCVIVLWSNESVKSDWVKTEADEGKRRRALVPVLIENVAIPLEFRRIETAKLYDWKGDLDHPELKLLLHAVAEVIGQEQNPPTFRGGKKKNKRLIAFGLDFSKVKNKVAVISLVLLVLISMGFAVKYLISPNNPSLQPATDANSSPTSTPTTTPTTSTIPIWETTVAGEWENSGNVLIQKSSSATPARIVAQNPNKRPYVVSFQARCITDGEFGVNFNYQNEQNYAEWNIGNSYRGSNINNIEGGKSLIQIAVPGQGVSSFPETAKPSSLMVGRWYSVRIFVDGFNIRGYLDDELKVDFTLPNYASSTGTFCLKTWATVAEFKNIKVE